MSKQKEDVRKFIERYRLSPEEMCLDILERHRDTIRVQKPKIAVANLMRIVAATLSIANHQGFHSMSLRELAEESGASMGSLYAYFDSKGTLAMMILRQVNAIVERVFVTDADYPDDARTRLRWILHSHVLLTEILQPWFFFAFMEAGAFHKEAREYVIGSELLTERVIEETLSRGMREGVFAIDDARLAASHIKPLLQDWYLKPWKYRRRGIEVDTYADGIVAFVERAIGTRDVATLTPA